MGYADLPQSIKLAVNAKREAIADELANFVSPPFTAEEYPVVLAIASGALTGTTLTAEQLAYLPSVETAQAFRDAYLGARAQFNSRSAELEASITVALLSEPLDETATIAAIEAV